MIVGRNGRVDRNVRNGRVGRNVRNSNGKIMGKQGMGMQRI